MEKKYRAEIFCTHLIKEVWAEDEHEAKERAEQTVFEENVNYERGDLITGYKIIPI